MHTPSVSWNWFSTQSPTPHLSNLDKKWLFRVSKGSDHSVKTGSSTQIICYDPTTYMRNGAYFPLFSFVDFITSGLI